MLLFRKFIEGFAKLPLQKNLNPSAPSTSEKTQKILENAHKILASIEGFAKLPLQKNLNPSAPSTSEKTQKILENAHKILASTKTTINTVRGVPGKIQRYRKKAQQVHHYVFHRYRLRLGLVGFALGGAFAAYVECKKQSKTLEQRIQGGLVSGLPIAALGFATFAVPEVGVPAALFYYVNCEAIEDRCVWPDDE